MIPYIRFLYHARWPLAVLTTVLFFYSVGQAKHLKLKSDFKELLPESFQSVKDLNRIAERVGGTGSLVVAIESDDPQASIRFGEALVAKLKQYPPEMIQRIEYNSSQAKAFFEKNKYLYMELADIQEIYNRLDRRIQREKLKSSGIYLDFQTPEERDNDFSVNDIEDKYKSKTANYENYLDGYFFDKDHKLMAILVKPPGSSTGVEFSKRLIAQVNQTIAELQPTTYHPSMKVGLTGKFRKVLFEYQTLIDDIVSTAALCVGLVGLAVFLYYRRLRMVGLMAWTTFNGAVWTFAITQWKIGFLTTQTAFLGSIIVGNGINYGLILMARYLEERRLGHHCLKALEISIPSTIAGTLASSVTTSVAFGTLLFTNIRGFSHFGFIGGLGMFLCWVATYTVLPVFLAITEQIWPAVKAEAQQKTRLNLSLMSPLTRWIAAYTKPLVRSGIALSVISFLLLLYFIPHSLEYDFSKLRISTKGREAAAEQELNSRIKPIFNASLTPAVLIVDRTEDTVPLCQEIERKNNLYPPEEQVVDSCKSLYTYVPEQQDEKNTWLAKIRDLVDKNKLDFLKDDQKKKMDEFKTKFEARHVKLSDVPESVVANFSEKNGDLGKLAYVYPNDKAALWNGKNLMRFADVIQKNQLPSGEVITASGDAVIFSDLLRAVMHDGPIATALAFLCVCLVVAIIFHEWHGIWFIIGTLTVGSLWMAGFVALLNIKINFFNFIAIPTTFGIGVDYGCNIYQRYKLEGKGSIPKVLRTTGGAVALCSLTTIIGYFTLIIAKSQALVSFGWIAIIGELTCLAAALIFIPALVIWRGNTLYKDEHH